MSETVSERRLAENEVVFRQYNENVEKGFEELRAMAKASDQEHLVSTDDNPLLFCCECSDENCLERIKLQPSRYAQIHKKRDRFVIVCGHETQTIERIVEKVADYCVIEKFHSPPEVASHLHRTDVDHTP